MAEQGATSYPPYPPYTGVAPPASVAETIIAGRDLRIQHKSLPRKPVHPPPKPAKPRGPKATDVKMKRRALRAHAQCLRRHGAVLTDRLERMTKPSRRAILYLWRDYANTLPAETITRLRSLLDADEPFKPDQAYEYFVNLRKTRKRTAATAKIHELKKDILAMYGDKRFLWARNASVAFARGIQQRLARPGRYSLADGMLRLSNIILEEMCGYMRMKTPSRRNTNPKAKFMMEMADKIAVWIDEVLSESDDRMLMMDFDEDDEVATADLADKEPPATSSTARSTPAGSARTTPAESAVTTPGESAPTTPGASETATPVDGAQTPVPPDAGAPADVAASPSATNPTPAPDTVTPKPPGT